MLGQGAGLELTDEFSDIKTGQAVEVAFVDESASYLWIDDAKRR